MSAGIGSRFGGLKQIEPVDDDGNYIIDYLIYDAIRCGIKKVVFIINKNNYKIFKKTIGERVSKKIQVRYAFQENPKNIEREKPLGTGHAVLCSKKYVSEKFIVVNSDDFYGYESLSVIKRELENDNDNFIMMGYKLKNTMPKTGKVKRGLCFISSECISKIDECEVEKTGKTYLAVKLSDGKLVKCDGNTIVSMNMFGFNQKIFSFLENDFKNFLSNPKNIKNGEFYLPESVTKSVYENKIQVRVIPTDSEWFGVTYREDLFAVREKIAKLKRDGKYPVHLWK